MSKSPIEYRGGCYIAPMTSVLGFRFSGISCGIKANAALDLGLIVADSPVTTAALFTRNLVRAHPVHVSEARVLNGEAQAFLANSGNANACNGPAGLAASLSTCAAVAKGLGIDEQLVLPSSTGVIGQTLPADKIESATQRLIDALSPDASDAFADAIRTTDRWRKVATTKIEKDGKTANFLAIGKGAGMFHPDVSPAGQLPSSDGSHFEGSDFAEGDLSGLHATMLVYILTDAKVDIENLKAALFEAADLTFNAATVDGDTSTNDSVYLMASGKSSLSLDEEELTKALIKVCEPLAKSMVEDGEGAAHAVTITVSGLQNDAEARDIARIVATSLLVKTAITGKDANWGRLLMAAGRAGVPFDPDCATILIDGICICRAGVPTDEKSDREASEKMKATSYPIELKLGKGPGIFSYITSDIGHGYIDVNAGYRS